MLLLNWSQGTICVLVRPLVPAILFIISQRDIEQTRGKENLFQTIVLAKDRCLGSNASGWARCLDCSSGTQKIFF